MDCKQKNKCRREIWPNAVTQLFCEMISHYTPPSCITANIISQAKSTHWTSTVIHQITPINWTQEWRSVLLCITKTLDVFEPAKIPTWKKYSLTAQAVGKWQCKISSLVYHNKMGNGSSQQCYHALLLQRTRHNNTNVNH